LFGACSAKPISKILATHHKNNPLSLTNAPVGAPPALCSICIQLAVVEINVLLNAVLQYELSDCADLCSYLNNTYASEACEVACDGLGLAAFIYALENYDIDPIYYSQLVDMCTIDDCVGDCIDIKRTYAQPATLPLGNSLNIVVEGAINIAWNGTGMIRLTLTGPDQSQTGNDFLINGGLGPVGPFAFGIQVDTTDSDNYSFEAGKYISDVQICNGECGSANPHSRIFADASTTFTLTQN